MKYIIKYFSAAAMLVLPALVAHAQDVGQQPKSALGNWQVEAAAYLWLPESRSSVSTPLGNVSTTLSASDALDALDFGAMVAANARKGNWALAADLFYLDLTLKSATPLGLLYSGAEVRNRLSSLSGYGLYTLHETDTLRLEAGGGLRLMSIDIDLTMRGNVAADRHFSISDNWVDPVVAIRATANLTETVKGVIWLEAGDFDIGRSSDRTWQVSAMVDWQINDKWTLGAGYRTLYVDRENGGVPYQLRMSGPVLGLVAKF